MQGSSSSPAVEIVSLNEELLSLDPETLRPVDLESRLELAIAAIRPCCLCEAFYCSVFAGCPPDTCAAFQVGGS